MIDHCRIAHFDDLKSHQQVQMLDVLNRPSKGPIFALNGGRPVALLKDEKVIAALVTDEDNRILHWDGQPSREFNTHFGHSPAEAIMREYVAMRGDGKLEFVGNGSDTAIKWFYKKIYDPNHTPTYENGENNGIRFSPQALRHLKPAIRSAVSAWRLYRPK